jgi:hypothetical protein
MMAATRYKMPKLKAVDLRPDTLSMDEQMHVMDLKCDVARGMVR